MAATDERRKESISLTPIWSPSRPSWFEQKMRIVFNRRLILMVSAVGAQRQTTQERAGKYRIDWLDRHLFTKGA